MAVECCGTSRIVGCRFSLYPMCDQFVEVILETLQEVDTSKVWMMTDDVSTCIRGRAEHVFDTAKAMFVLAASRGIHVVWNGTFSIGCPGDTQQDAYLEVDDVRLNEPKLADRPVTAAAQFALYPLGTADYMSVIYDQVEHCKELGTYTKGIHYATRLDGDARQVFKSLEESFARAQESGASHVVMTAAVSANSPSRKGQEAE
ncbi:YkoF family thiamine/hydroxymethylpyrimidine-binding protein [Brevibacillus sp. B_LB10_24]|uniref:YkoF family thiamine/hydroxymethylpyrimidine-binding protein n=1 Tax=Brevibacillus sp. B_LB10_24 TaxID=3380645 RepID=UPI0038B972DD